MFEIAQIFPLKLMLLDDHLLFSQGIAELIRKIDPDSHVSIFTSVEKATASLQTTTYTFLITDLIIPGSDVRKFISSCKKKYPQLLLLVISSSTDIRVIKELFADGIDAYISKAVNVVELKMALERVYHGEKYISSDLGSKMANSLLDIKKTALTNKELEILRIVAAGKTVAQTANELLISPATVMAHRRNIMAKLDLHSAAELVKYAYENKLV